MVPPTSVPDAATCCAIVKPTGSGGVHALPRVTLNARRQRQGEMHHAHTLMQRRCQSLKRAAEQRRGRARRSAPLHFEIAAFEPPRILCPRRERQRHLPTQRSVQRSRSRHDGSHPQHRPCGPPPAATSTFPLAPAGSRSRATKSSRARTAGSRLLRALAALWSPRLRGSPRRRWPPAPRAARARGPSPRTRGAPSVTV